MGFLCHTVGFYRKGRTNGRSCAWNPCNIKIFFEKQGLLVDKFGTDGSITIEDPATGGSGIADDVNGMFGSSGLMKSKDAKALGTKTIVVDLDSGVSWGSSFTIGDAAFGS
jgi:hypothetical protein